MRPIVRFIKRWNILFDTVRSYFFLKHLVIDPKNMRSSQYYRQVKTTQHTSGIPFFLDRQREFQQYFKVSAYFLARYYLRHGFPTTNRFKKKYVSFFDGTQDSDTTLHTAYSRTTFDYSLRQMMAYSRHTIILPFLKDIITGLPRKNRPLRVLDYGCGVSDIGLLFASLGWDVTIVELTEKTSFAAWRYEQRGHSVRVIPVYSPAKYPTFRREEFDLIIATEILEHLRNPLLALKNLTYALRKDGLLFDTTSQHGGFEKEVYGDHLKEAWVIGNSREYTSFFTKHYLPVQVENTEVFLFKKR